MKTFTQQITQLIIISDKLQQIDEDIYGFCIVHDPVNKIVGSAPAYTTRIDITQDIKTQPLATALR